MTEFLTAVLNGLTLAGQSILVGGCVFAALVSAHLLDKAAVAGTLRWASAAGLAAALSAASGLALTVAQLTSALGLPASELLDAEFAHHAARTIATALLAAGLCRLRVTARAPWLAVAAAMGVVAATATAGHANSRLDGRLPLIALAFAHQMAAGIWLGGIPFLLISLRRAPNGPARLAICRRFSAMATAAVAVLAASAAMLTLSYIGSWTALIGSDFGAMALIKAVLFGAMLLLGLGNLRAGSHLDQPAPYRRLRAFAVAEIGIGLAVLTVAATLAVQQPPLAEAGGVMAPAELLSRLAPRWPALTAAVPAISGTAADRAWGEMTHHWAGLVVLAMGLLAALRPLPGFAWARHWPLLFALIAAGIVLLADPDSWPLGSYGIWGKPGDAEVVQHRLAALMVLAFGAMEWAVQTGRRQGRATLAFPLSCGIGGFLLLTHGHPSANSGGALIIHLSHMTIAVLGVAAGAGRWIELAGDPFSQRVAARVWPLALAFTGVVLLLYREG